MARHLLCPLVLLLLLLPPACAGELCRAWAHGWASPVDLFVCPRPGARDVAKFCCGSCRQPYCCASEVARLDQRQCLVEAQTARPPPTSPPTPFPTLLIVAWVSFGALALTITAVAVRCFCAHRCPRAAGCLKSHRKVQPIRLVPVSSASQCPSLDRSVSSHSGSPPSYATREDAEPSPSTAGTPQSRQVFIPVFGNSTPSVWFHHRNSRIPGDGASASPPTDLSDGETAAPTSNLL